MNTSPRKSWSGEAEAEPDISLHLLFEEKEHNKGEGRRSREDARRGGASASPLLSPTPRQWPPLPAADGGGGTAPPGARATWIWSPPIVGFSGPPHRYLPRRTAEATEELRGSAAELSRSPHPLPFFRAKERRWLDSFLAAAVVARGGKSPVNRSGGSEEGGV